MEFVVYVAFVYLGIGVLFSIPFLLVWVKKVDSNAKDSSFGFRLAILPGVIAFWPILLSRVRAGSTTPPSEVTPHKALVNAVDRQQDAEAGK